MLLKNLIIKIYDEKIDLLNKQIIEVNDHIILLNYLLTKVIIDGPNVEQSTLDSQGVLIERALGIKDPGVNKRKIILSRFLNLDKEMLSNLYAERRKTEKLLEATRTELINEFVNIQYGINELEIMNDIYIHEATEPLVNKIVRGSLLDLY